MKGKRNRIGNKILAMLMLQTVIIIFSALVCFWVTNFIAALLGFGNGIFSKLLLFLPISAVIGAINYFMSKIIYKYVSELSDGIARVSGGDFKVRLKESKVGPLSEVYADFNKMCEELDNAENTKNDFINNYAHELRTPITSINGFAKLILEEDIPLIEQKKYLKLIYDESKRLAELATNTMLMSKLDSQSILQDIEEYNLGEQLRQCVILFSEEWSKKDINMDGDEINDISYNGNYSLMQEVWCNLLSNAIKYTPAGGEIKISCKEDRGFVQVKIADNGIGMREEVIDKIFDKYYQGDSSHSKRGLGLGLSIVKKIVDLSEGEIDVKSKENEGCEFTVKLPLIN